eukprot:TRINITY_DN15043_c0_g1_i1.p1 TRINITY_DN15043_c0_g1~~TRINITY_DN15043_c0_g1_i1.p1  ORF type:complete len:109 (+),score=29.84 TRINITY_DN15043_c0_g1_i1:324-650(+)
MCDGCFALHEESPQTSPKSPTKPPQEKGSSAPPPAEAEKPITEDAAANLARQRTHEAKAAAAERTKQIEATSDASEQAEASTGKLSRSSADLAESQKGNGCCANCSLM